MSNNGNIRKNKVRKAVVIVQHNAYYVVQHQNRQGCESKMCKPLQQLKGFTAQELITKFDLDRSFPVDLGRVMKYYKISLLATDFRELEEFPEIVEETKKRGAVLGAVASKGDNLVILYNKDDTRHRQKFTIAHELAHCCLHADQLEAKGHIQYRIDSDTNNQEEINANIFAGELLIPKSAIDIIYRTIHCPSLDVLVNIFDVSKNVLRARLDYLQCSYADV